MASAPELVNSSSATDDAMENGSARGSTSSVSVLSGSTEAAAPITESTQLLRLEALSDAEARVCRSQRLLL